MTNNRRDFRRLYSQLEEHPGLVVMLEATRIHRQVELFTAAVDSIASRSDLTNLLVEVDGRGFVKLAEFRTSRNT